MKTITLKINVLALLVILYSCSSDDNGGTMQPESMPPPNPVLVVENLTANVAENPSVTAVVAQFEVTQENLTDPLTFQLLALSPAGALTVNSAGQLLASDAALFDFERREVITGEIRASSGSLVQNASFTLNITDVDEAAVPFITRWNLSGSELMVQLPLYQGTGEDVTEYDFRVDWGDGSEEGLVTAFDDPDAQHTYSSAGLKTITVTGTLKGFNFLQNSVSNSLFVDVSQWGDMQLGNAGGYFFNCQQLEDFTASDTPILKNVTNLRSTFAAALNFNGDISDWNVSNVTDMGSMFFSNLTPTSFNGDISKWDVSNVTNMLGMFSGASFFNGDISGWDVSNVTNMGSMFKSASSFNQDISNWEVSSVTYIGSMFDGASSFNQDISNWDVSNVTGMSFMFRRASTFNQDISNWEVSKVVGMRKMFESAAAFSQDLSGWPTDNVTSCADFNTGSALTPAQLPILGPCF
nr:BspA family leucine-rich repeat surface protein [uncultured Allomuricauda sp.]